MTADQVLAALWRRKTLVAAVALGVFAVGAVTVATLPSMYRSTVVVHVEQQHPAPELVQRTVSEDLTQRLLSVRQELMGKPVLERVIQELNLYPEVVSKQGMDAAVDAMRVDLDVKPAGEAAFELTYQGRNPETVAKVTNLIPQVYAEQYAKLREAEAVRATQVFSDEINALKKTVTDWEKRIAQFKVDHMGELPEQLETNMHALDRIVTALNTKSEELRVAETHRSDLARAHYAADTEAGRLKAAEDGLTQQLVQARSQWTEDHPEVERLKGELTAMKQKRIAAEAQLTAEKAERAKSVEWVQNVQSDIAALQQQAAAIQKRLDQTPRWAEQLGVFSRDYEIAKAKYQSVISRKVEAEIAQELEAKSAPGMFHVVSPAVVASTPFKPDRMSALMVALLVSLAAGVLTGVVIEMRDDSIRDLGQLKGHLPIPVLAVVPQLNGKAERRVLMPSVTTRPPSTSTPTTLN